MNTTQKRPSVGFENRKMNPLRAIRMSAARSMPELTSTEFPADSNTTLNLGSPFMLITFPSLYAIGCTV